MAPRNPPAARPHASTRGVTLIEALVALAVMSFGMLAVVGVQATLRVNGDVAKQRAEAVRIGQEAVERLRTYTQLQTDPDGIRTAYDDLLTTTAVEVGGYTTNTVYTVERIVGNHDALLDRPAPRKTLRIQVAWQDRTGKPQAIVLDTQIARIEPTLTAAAVNSGAFRQSALKPQGRHAAIPSAAKDLGGGFSALKMPGRDGVPSTSVWVFNNATGLITGVCTVAAGMTTGALSSTDIASCRDNTLAHLLSGFVRFHTDNRQPTAADAENPNGRARNLDISLTLAGPPRATVCHDDAPATATAALLQNAVTYYCLIPANAERTWAGYSTIEPQPFVNAPETAWAIPVKGLPASVPVTHQLCRYTPATSDAQVVPNTQHPYQYRIEYTDGTRQRLALPMPPLVNQNFLVVLSTHTCPSDGPANPMTGDFVNSNTLLHRPLP